MAEGPRFGWAGTFGGPWRIADATVLPDAVGAHPHCGEDFRPNGHRNWSRAACQLPPAGVVVLATVFLVVLPIGALAAGSSQPHERTESSVVAITQGTTTNSAAEAALGQGLLGPDVIVADLPNALGFGQIDGIAAFAVGTTSCNIGDQPLSWVAGTNQHPVIAQNLYRLQDGRFEQLGQSWLKHGFAALTGNICGLGCNNPGSSSLLGVGCSDPYSAGLNGQQTNLGPKSDVNPHTGGFAFPRTLDPPTAAVIGRRLQVFVKEIDPAQEGGGVYFVESHYVTPDDAAAGNQDNNASYRQVGVAFNASAGRWELNLVGVTRRGDPAIRAWKEADDEVTETDIRIPGEGLFILAAKVTDLGDGFWRYEYALHNLNSDRAGASFGVPVDQSATIRNMGFRDVDYHSGEIYDLTDWEAVVSNGSITWSTRPHAVDDQANALRWGTLYNFRFDADVPPQPSVATLGLFKPGVPSTVGAATTGPVINAQDCNDNGVADSLDIINGASQDCDGDWVPDECESFGDPGLTTARVASGLENPLYVTAPAGDRERLFIVEQGGRIKILSGGSVLARPFLDLTAIVLAEGERGLLSMAFHPSYGTNGWFFVNYTDLDADTVIARYSVTSDPDVANPGSAVVLKTISQDFENHNGGQLQFGPDGFLYVGMGDGGGGNDTLNRAQDLSTLLGKMLRLDVDNPPEYIPADNPFVGVGVPLDEVWAIGLRNPWRFSFDRFTGDVYIGDVGQGGFEEIDLQPADSAGGENYGWRCMEGFACTGLSGCACDDPSLTLPILTYENNGIDCSITGGYVYRGCAIPGLSGTYFYADFCSAFIRSFRFENATVAQERDRTDELTPAGGPIETISSFGEDGVGELYIVSLSGDIYKIMPDTGSPFCGDGVIEPGEQCDDGNSLPGDGCDENCQIGPGGAHDDCAGALAVAEGDVLFDTTDATTDGPDEPAVCNFFGDPRVESDLWYCYTASCSGPATVSLCGSSFDTKVAVYEGCACPTGEAAIACNDEACGSQSEVSFPASACSSYLIRVGGAGAAQGPGTMSITCQEGGVNLDCNNNGIDDAADINCGTSGDQDDNGVPDECETEGDFVRGGRLYDRWWVETGGSEPKSDHPLWALRPDGAANTRSGAATWRCKECHGWDYKGVDGQYAVGAHRTGFAGVLGTSRGASELFELLREPPSDAGGSGVPNGHDYGSVVADGEIEDLVAFMLLGLTDDDLLINPASGGFLGDPVQGALDFASGGIISCTICHGVEGTAINFGTPEDPRFVGMVARENPWEFLHKVRVGQPGAPMPSWLAGGGSNEGAAGLGRYAQTMLLTDCLTDLNCDDGIECTEDVCGSEGRCIQTPLDEFCIDDGLFCNGLERCDAQFGCVGSGNPCADPVACNEEEDRCECDAAVVTATWSRFLSISPQPGDSNTPVALVVTPDCPGGESRFVGGPTGPNNVARLVSQPERAARLTAAQWGETVHVTGLDIVPDRAYRVEVDCGTGGFVSLSAPAAGRTQRWGDTVGEFADGAWTPPDGIVNIVDITAVLDAFRHAPTAPPVYAVDLFGCIPNELIEIIDAVGAVDGFRGFSYFRSTFCSDPCP